MFWVIKEINIEMMLECGELARWENFGDEVVMCCDQETKE